MAEQIVFGIRIDGIDGTIRNQQQLTDAIKETKKQLAGKNIDSPEYKKLQKTLGQLTASQKNFRKETRDQAREAQAGAKGVSGAYRRMSAQLAISRERMKDLAAAGKTNTIEFSRLSKEVGMLDKQLKKIDANAGQFQRNVGNYSSAFGGLANFFTGGLLVGGISDVATAIVNLGKKSIEAADVQEKAVAKVDNIVRQTGEAAGFTTSQLEDMAKELQKNSLLGDEQILNDVTAQLLTFTKVTGETFDRAQVAAMDLATVVDTDLRSNTIQLGKALNDPIKGVTALSRAGVMFSDEQKETIETLQQSGDLLGAQNIILTELEAQYGGAAKAASEAGLGGFQRLSNAFQDLLEPMGRAIIDLGDTFLPILNLLPGYIQDAFGIIQRVFAPVIESAQRLASRFEETTDWSKILGKTIEFTSLPIKILGVVIGAVIDFVDHLVTSYQGAQEESEEFKQSTISVTAFFKSLLNAVLQAPAALNGVFKAIGQLMKNIKNLDFSTSIIDAFNDGFDEYKKREAAEQGEDIADEVAKGAAGKTAAALGDQLKKEKNSITDAGEKGIGEPLVEGSLAALSAGVNEMKKQLQGLVVGTDEWKQLASEIGEAEATLKRFQQRVKDIQSGAIGQGETAVIATLGITGIDESDQGFDEFLQKHIERADAKIKIDKQKHAELLEAKRQMDIEYAMFALELTTEIANAAFEIQRNNLERQTNAQLDALHYETEQKLQGVEQGSAEESAILEEQRRKQQDIELEAAKKQKQIDIQQAIINGALAITKTFANLGFPAGLLGAAFVAAQTAAQVAVIRSQGFAEGGFTGHGGKYDPAGTVHKGEVVWSQRDVAAVGGPTVADRMRPTYKGYADGGMVGSFTGGVSGGSITDREIRAIEAATERGTRKGTLEGTKEASKERSRLQRLQKNISV